MGIAVRLDKKLKTELKFQLDESGQTDNSSEVHQKHYKEFQNLCNIHSVPVDNKSLETHHFQGESAEA